MAISLLFGGRQKWLFSPGGVFTPPFYFIISSLLGIHHTTLKGIYTDAAILR